ncbi:ribonuclease R [Vulgatibacter incomptus]|uniref:Ribonuclease R n=1 Tax=Vulgatibacter incomptus TaxID=1391653 RepID=A0A0K1PF54_9BACT|nr:ribonuclease R [Vulgatibacter incomptus]AKU91729.1 3'-to-5' exoribonuclease RNase R [Vulgatibacter incomptus]
MPRDEAILEAVDRGRGELLSARQIAEKAGIHPGEYTALKRRLRELTRAGTLERDGRRFRRAVSGAPVVVRERPRKAPPEAGARPSPKAAEAGARPGPKAMEARREGPPARPWKQEKPARRERAPAPRGEPGARPRGVREEGGRPARGAGEVVGRLTLRPEGYGFVKRLEGPEGDDVFLPPHELREAMDGDLLRVRVVRGKFGRDAGVLVEIVSHRRRNFLGTLELRGKAAFVTPVDPTLPRFVSVKPIPEAKAGQVVKVAITSYADETGALRGTIEKVVGEPGDPIVEVLEVAYANGFSEDFPDEVRREAEAVPPEVSEADHAGRRDLRELRLVTIDGEDARDFDDAVFVEKLRSGYRLVVAIADVAHYVTPNTRLDDEAVSRATSVYFPNHVLPMLPENLSNGICSLNPGVDRLCMVCDLALDREGKPVEAEIYEGVMRSHQRWTYEKVAEVLAAPPARGRPLEKDLRLAGELAAKLRQQRTKRGALDFDLPESRAILDEHMLPTAIVRRERNDAHRMIEEFMLAANEAVARYFSERELPSVYRVHGEPDPEKLENFARLATAVGFSFDLEEGMPPTRLGELLRAIEGTPQQRALNTMLLRSMMQAVYQPENIGHYGLAAEHYLHFTSPIRRYPDLLVHRLLKEHWARGGSAPRGHELAALEERLDGLAAQSSERERAATEAEREIDQYFKCLFVRDRVGEAFDATVISVTDFGFFAELDELPVEGLVRAEELGTSWELDEERYRLVFPATGRAFGMGDRVRVEIASVDLAKRQISLALLVGEEEGEAPVFPETPFGRVGTSPLSMAIARQTRREGARKAGPPKRGAKPEGRGRTSARPAPARGGKAPAKAKGGKAKGAKTKTRPGKGERSAKKR